jgi:starch-binding outer membrane protein, SusD/RagB family
MRTTLFAGAVALTTLVGTTGCRDFLTGGDVSQDPNNPPTATINSLMASVQANLFLTMEADLARTTCTWMQQCSGQAAEYLGVGNYTATGDGDFWYFNWAAVYGGGGILDLRAIRARALDPSVADSLYAGVTDVLVAYFAGTAADLWGSVPFTEASQPVAFPTPMADPQLVVYDSVQGRLDEALTFFAATGPTNIGPGDVDLVYGGDVTKWTALANTLKARFFLHTANVIPAAYDSALKYSAVGIASSADDYHSAHTGDVSRSNIWFQFFTTAGFGYMASGKYLVDFLANSGDPRLAEYYAPIPADPTGTVFRGAPPGVVLATDSISTLSDTRLAPDFPQPLVTWAENELIAAEASYKTGDEPNALSKLTAVQAAAGVTTPGGLTGDSLFAHIMREKYVQDFQNIEAWSDWRRTCIPALTPAPGNPSIPLRLPIPFSERTANPNLAPTDPYTPLSNNPGGC